MNSVLEFVWIVMKILTEKILNNYDIYIDNILVKEPRIKYNNWEILSSIQ